MKKLISILLVMAMVSSFAMSIGCFADKEDLFMDNQSELLLNQENEKNIFWDLPENNCGLACKTKNFAGATWKSLKEIPTTFKVLVATAGASIAFFAKFYKTYKNEILKLRNEITQLQDTINTELQDENKDLKNKNNRLQRKNNDLSRTIGQLRLENQNLNNQLNTFTFGVNSVCNQHELNFNFNFANVNGFIKFFEDRLREITARKKKAKAQKQQNEELQLQLNTEAEEHKKQMEELQHQHTTEAEEHKKQIEELKQKLVNISSTASKAEKRKEKNKKLKEDLENLEDKLEDKYEEKFKILSQQYEDRIKAIEGLLN